jgi:4'-phosphopantetheinyl transferase
LGIDVERLRPMKDAAGLARRYFAAAEVTAWEALADDERLPAFFRCWTRKEAYLKALGDGLRAPLDRFVVTLSPGEPPRLVAPSPHDDAADWWMHDIDIGGGYLAAVVAPAGCRVTRYFACD